MPTISQIVSASYPAVSAKRPANQWDESSFMRELQRQGAIKHVGFGPTIEEPLDFQANPDALFLSSDMEDTGTTPTEIGTTASYAPAQLVVPMTIPHAWDSQNPSENQKYNLAAAIIDNCRRTHDSMLEAALFSTTTNGFLGLQSIVPDNGQGQPGGIDASSDFFWRNPVDTNGWNDESDIEAAMTAMFVACEKGSGSPLSPKLIVSGSEPHATFEASQQALQRYVDTDELKAGFKVLGFKTARYVYSPNGSGRIYFLNPTSAYLKVGKGFFRKLYDFQEIPNAAGRTAKMYSTCQFVTNNKSRLGVVLQAS